MDTGGDGEGGMSWEIRFDINILPCVKQTATGNLLYSTGSSFLVLCDDLDGWDGVGVWQGGLRGRVCVYVYG